MSYQWKVMISIMLGILMFLIDITATAGAGIMADRLIATVIGGAPVMALHLRTDTLDQPVVLHA